MAKTLYDYWFVQFDFPGKTASHTKAVVENGVEWGIEKEIPEGLLGGFRFLQSGWFIASNKPIIMKNAIIFATKIYGKSTF